MATFTTGDGVGLHGWEYGFYGLTAANAGTFVDGGIPATGRGRADRHPGFRKLQALLGYDPPFADPADPAPLRDHAAQDWRDVVARVSVPAPDDCGHAIAVDQPEAVSATMLGFLR